MSQVERTTKDASSLSGLVKELSCGSSYSIPYFTVESAVGSAVTSLPPTGAERPHTYTPTYTHAPSTVLPTSIQSEPRLAPLTLLYGPCLNPTASPVSPFHRFNRLLRSSVRPRTSLQLPPTPCYSRIFSVPKTPGRDKFFFPFPFLHCSTPVETCHFARLPNSSNLVDSPLSTPELATNPQRSSLPPPSHDLLRRPSPSSILRRDRLPKILLWVPLAIRD